MGVLASIRRLCQPFPKMIEVCTTDDVAGLQLRESAESRVKKLRASQALSFAAELVRVRSKV